MRRTLRSISNYDLNGLNGASRSFGWRFTSQHRTHANIVSKLRSDLGAFGEPEFAIPRDGLTSIGAPDLPAFFGCRYKPVAETSFVPSLDSGLLNVVCHDAVEAAF